VSYHGLMTPNHTKYSKGTFSLYNKNQNESQQPTKQHGSASHRQPAPHHMSRTTPTVCRRNTSATIYSSSITTLTPILRKRKKNTTSCRQFDTTNKKSNRTAFFLFSHHCVTNITYITCRCSKTNPINKYPCSEERHVGRIRRLALHMWERRVCTVYTWELCVLR